MIILISWLGAQEAFLIIINIYNSRTFHTFVKNMIHVFSRIIKWIESSKEQQLFEK